MLKKAKYIMFLILAMSASYIFAIELYSINPNEVQNLYQCLQRKDITYEKVIVELNGICYDHPMTEEEIREEREEMMAALSHNEACPKPCRVQHTSGARWSEEEEERNQWYTLEEKSEDWKYGFTMKQKEERHDNTYYHLSIEGMNLEHIETLYSRSYELLRHWGASPTKSICFIGHISGNLSKEEREEIINQLLKKLQGSIKDYYEDDRNPSTCAYYGYTPKVNEYIKGSDGKKSNIQISFSYNEDLDCTKIMAAFPFTNLSF